MKYCFFSCLYGKIFYIWENKQGDEMKKIRQFFSMFICIIMMIVSFTTNIYADEIDTNEQTKQIEVILNVDDELMNKYINNFTKKNPGVEIKYTRYSDYETDIMKRIDSGDYGDVLFIPASLDSEGVQTYFEPLGYVKDFNDKYNFVENAYVVDDVVYSLPSSAYFKGILYNREVFDKAGVTRIPRTQEEFIEALSLIKEKTGAIPFYTNYEMEWVLNDWSFFPYIEMCGDASYRGEKFVYEKNPFLEGSNFYNAYKLLYEIVDKGLCEEKNNVLDWGEVCTKVSNGEIASVVVGTWSYNQIKNSGDNNDSIGFMPFPNEIDGKQYVTLGIDYGFCINKNSQNKELAKKFIEFMLDESGYAVENDRISIVKSDPLPDVYSKIDNLELMISSSLTEQSYYYFNILSEKINPESAQSIQAVIDEARKKDGNYDALMKSWNEAWESARPTNMKTYSYEYLTRANSFSDEMSQDNSQSFIMNNFDVEYSNAEKEYIQSKKQLKVGYLTNMAPFQYEEKKSNNQNEFVGLAKVICESIKDSTKLELVYIPFKNNKAMMESLVNGDIDMIAGITSDEQSAENLILSKSYLQVSNAIIKADTLELSNLNEKTEGVVEGNQINTKLYTQSDKKEFDSLEALVNAVDKKRADYAISNYYSANYYIKDGDYSYVSVLPLTEKTDYCIAFSQDVDTSLVSICNKCIYSFPEESIQMMLMQYMEPQAKKVTLKRYIITNPIHSSLIIGGFILFVIGFILIIKREKNKNKKKQEMDIKRYTTLAQLTDEYVFEYDFKTDIIHFDNKFSDKFGFETDVCISDESIENKVLTEFNKEFTCVKSKPDLHSEPFQLVDSVNEKQWYRIIAYIVRDDEQNPQHIIGKLLNVDDYIKQQKAIQQKADSDFLTSLYNRTGFERSVAQMYNSYCDAKNYVFAVLDLDNFKSVNDSLGHLGGDKALIKLADELRTISSDKILCARYGGDEFVISMFDVSKDEADEIFDNLVRNMNQILNFEGKSHLLSISLGAVYCDKVKTTQEMFEMADRVLYSVKQNGKNQYKLLSFAEVNFPD